MSWAQCHTDKSSPGGAGGGGGYSTNFYTAEVHPLTFYTPISIKVASVKNDT